MLRGNKSWELKGKVTTASFSVSWKSNNVVVSTLEIETPLFTWKAILWVVKKRENQIWKRHFSSEYLLLTCMNNLCLGRPPYKLCLGPVWWMLAASLSQTVCQYESCHKFDWQTGMEL